jgi:signal peptidase I
MQPPPEGSSTETYHRGRERPKRREALTGVAVAAGLAYAVLRWRPFRVEIAGPSMAPTLLPGDWALALGRSRIRRGDVVVVEHPHRPGFEMVKRIVAVPGERGPSGVVLRPDEWWVEGDVPAESTDSRHFGPVRTGHVKAVVRLIYWPASRRRLL